MNRTSLVRVLLPALSFLVLGWCWALASPPGSAADDDSHLASIWCAAGTSEGCVTGLVPDTVYVPDYVANAACFAFRQTSTASCVTSLTGKMVPTTRYNRGHGEYPGVFYRVLHVFVGPDINRSVLMMRGFNVALAAFLLGAALAVCRPAPRRSVALAWMVTLIPISIFFIASTNPSSWVIMSIGTFWAFLLTLVKSHSLRERHSQLALVGVVLTAFLALGARSDSAVYLGLSFASVLILQWTSIRHRWLRWTMVIVPVVLAIGAAPFSLGRYLSNPVRFPGAYLPMDQPNPLLKVLLELPAFTVGLLGGQPPMWVQRDDGSNFGMIGYTSPGFTYGVGWTDAYTPSLVSALALTAFAGLLFLGLRSYSRRKVIVLALLLLAYIAQVVYMRAAFGFEPGWYLQPRYFIPSLVLFAGIMTLSYPIRTPILGRLQAAVLVTLLSLAASVAFLAIMSRYTVSQTNAFTNLSTATGWWWPRAPSPVVTWIIATLAGVAMYIGLAWEGMRSSGPSRNASEVHPSGESANPKGGLGAQPVE